MDSKLKIRSILLVILVIGIAIISSGYSTEQFDLSQYPYSIAKKSEIELKKIEQEFRVNNGATWSAVFNPYTGLIFSAGNINFKETASALSKEESQRIIFDFLKKNREFFGLEEFRIEIDPIYEGVSGPNYEDYAYVIEPHQIYRNLFIPRVGLNRELPYVCPDDYKNRISLIFTKQSNRYIQKPHLEFHIHYFYYYPEIKAPTEPRISQEEAIKRLYGYGRDKNSFWVSRLVILPWPNKEKTKLEYRLVWQIEIGGNRLVNESGMYTAYVDAITGEVITSRQNFVT